MPKPRPLAAAPASPPTPPEGDWLADQHGVAQLHDPRSILDLVNYQMHLIEALNASRVTRICEGMFGITRREWRFVALLAALGAQAPSDLALRAGLDRSRTSKALVSLRNKGLVARRPQQGDHRRAEVTLTPQGQALYERIFPQVREVNQALLAPLSAEEVALLAQLLNRLRRQAVVLADQAPVPASADRRHGGSRRAWTPPG